MKSNGTSWAAPASTDITRTTASHAQIQDFDGDGLDDGLFLDSSNNVKWFRNEGGSFASAATLKSGVASVMGGAANVPRADFNGDGRADLFYGTVQCLPPPYSTCNLTGYTAIASGSGFTNLEVFATGVLGGAQPLDVRVLDANGDGMDDVLYAHSSTNTWYLRLSEGNDGLGGASNTGISSNGWASSMVADYNNDGLAAC